MVSLSNVIAGGSRMMKDHVLRRGRGIVVGGGQKKQSEKKRERQKERRLALEAEASERDPPITVSELVQEKAAAGKPGARKQSTEPYRSRLGPGEITRRGY